MDDEVREAIGAYYREQRRQGFEDYQISQPSSYSDVHEDRVILHNCNGYLMTYYFADRTIAYDEEDRILVEGEDEDDEGLIG